MTLKPPLKVDIISDVVCPWCWIGAAGLMKAASEDDQPLNVTWRPYQLDPTTPREGKDRRAGMLARFGGDEAALRAASAHVEDAAQAVGLNPQFSTIAKTPNTLDAHRLILWAKSAGVQEIVAEALFQAYFVHGEDLTKSETLIAIARGCGMDGALVADLLASDRDVETVQAEINVAREMGVTGVPCFVFDGRLAVVGAQEPAKFKRVFAKAHETMLA